MKELTITIPDDSAELVTELVEKLGGSIDKKERRTKRITKLSKGKGKDISLKPSKKPKKEKIDHTYLFGKWKDFDIDPEKLREELWKRY